MSLQQAMIALLYIIIRFTANNHVDNINDQLLSHSLKKKLTQVYSRYPCKKPLM